MPPRVRHVFWSLVVARRSSRLLSTHSPIRFSSWSFQAQYVSKCIPHSAPYIKIQSAATIRVLNPKQFQMSYCQNNSNSCNSAKRSAKPAGGPSSKVSRTGSSRSHLSNRSSLGGEHGDAMSIDDETMKTGLDMDGVEILDAPIKSHSDKKSYRLVVKCVF